MTIKTKFEIGEEVWFWDYPNNKTTIPTHQRRIGEKEWLSAKISCFQISEENDITQIYAHLSDGRKINQNELFKEHQYKNALRAMYHNKIKEFKEKLKELDTEKPTPPPNRRVSEGRQPAKPK